MDNRFNAYNTHWLGADQFLVRDPHLRVLDKQPYCYQHPIIKALPDDIAGIYTLGGGRQIGKNTLLKQWMARLLKSGITPQAIVFFTGELIDDHHALVALLQHYMEQPVLSDYRYIIIDEITYVKNWEKGIKFMADAGYFEHCVVILTGSDLSLMQSARMSFPGRRGVADKVDYHIYPLSFKEVLTLKKTIPDIDQYLSSHITPSSEVLQTLYQAFKAYLKHGGYLTAINDIARHGKINMATFEVYSDWIRGDILKRGKQESYLKEIILAIIKRYNKQVSWHNIADVLSIDSHKTVADYCQLLATMDALFIQSALLTDKLIAAPKKARKLTFTDPFIFHALKQWVMPAQADPNVQIALDLADPSIAAEIVKSVVSNQYRRYYPTYYIKSAGEIDVAYVDKGTFWPIEVKWKNQFRADDLKQIRKYANGRVLAKVTKQRVVDNIMVEPLPLALLR